MFEEKKNKVSLELQVKKQEEIKQQLVGNILPHNGHKLFEINFESGEIKEAEFQKELTAIAFDQNNYHKRVLIKPNHGYCSALNIKNAKKHFNKKSSGDKRF